VSAVPSTAPAGLLNFRDVGGLPAGPGRRVRRGVLFRSESPQFLTSDGARHLLDRLGLRTRIDLRRAGEVDREGRGPVAGPRLAVVHHPVMSRRAERELQTDVPVLTRWEPVVEHYLGYLAVSGAAIAGAVSALAVPRALPALVHCAAGKDRTGVVVSFALAVAQVANEDIAADYAANPEGVAATVERLRRLPGYGPLIDAMPVEANITPADYMTRFLAEIDGRFGGPRAWLATHGGVAEQDLDALAAALTEPAPTEPALTEPALTERALSEPVLGEAGAWPA
jgi:protein-tyrosine phosphatase